MNWWAHELKWEFKEKPIGYFKAAPGSSYLGLVRDFFPHNFPLRLRSQPPINQLPRRWQSLNR